MGNLLHTNLRTQSSMNTSSTGSGKLRRKLRQKCRTAKLQKTEEEATPNQVQVPAEEPPAGSKLAPSHSNFYFSIYYPEELTDVCIIDWLPNEMISHCLSFLPVHDIYKVSQVSQKLYKAASDTLLWKYLCYRDLKITQKWASLTWLDYYKLVRCITWDAENCCSNEFKFSDHYKTITKVTSYGVATGRSKHLFIPSGRKYTFDVRVNFRRPNFFYGIGFIDKEINFNFVKAAYPKADSTEVQERKYDLQWFYWSDGNCWDILGSHPVNTKTRTFVAKKGIERPKPSSMESQQPSLAFYSNDVIGVVLDYDHEQPLLTFFLNGNKVHQFTLPKQIELYLAVYFYNANDSVTIEHCESDKYDRALIE